MNSAPIAAVIVAFNAEDFILDCVTSVLASEDADVRVIVVDNASSDATREVVRKWAAGGLDYHAPTDLPVPAPDSSERPPLEIVAGSGVHREGPLARLTLVESERNGGFAAGVNLGLRVALSAPDVSDVWILNPDSVASRGAAAAYRTCAAANPGYGMITGRACYYHDPEIVQIDGGFLNRWTGVSSNANVGRRADAVDMPEGATLDFAFGGNMLVSRDFVERCGEMPEDYFLYYEEVDWSLRRGALPILSSQDALVYHRAGASIGSPIFGARNASPFSLYFKHRARMMFVRRYLPASLPVAMAYTLAKAAQSALSRDGGGAAAILRGGFGLAPPDAVARRLSPAALSRLGVARA